MKRTLLFCLLLVLCSGEVFAQRDYERHQEKVERVNAARIGFVTDRLKLSGDEAEKFWPIYNEYSTKRQELYFETRKRLRQGKATGLSESEKNRLLDETMELKEDELDLQKSYKAKLLKVISVKQYIELLNAERDFNAMLMEKLRERKSN